MTLIILSIYLWTRQDKSYKALVSNIIGIYCVLATFSRLIILQPQILRQYTSTSKDIATEIWFHSFFNNDFSELSAGSNENAIGLALHHFFTPRMTYSLDWKVVRTHLWAEQVTTMVFLVFYGILFYFRIFRASCHRQHFWNSVMWLIKQSIHS